MKFDGIIKEWRVTPNTFYKSPENGEIKLYSHDNVTWFPCEP